jgi:hypothetical protein
MQSLAKLITPELFETNTERIKVLPFPGKHPTRWKIRIFDQDQKQVFVAATRPNPSILRWLNNKFPKGGGWISLVEFDRLGAFKSAYRQGPTPEYPWGRMAKAVQHYYYPWHAYGGDVFGPWRQPIYSKLLSYKGRNFYVYSPHEKMFNLQDANMVERMREFKRWLGQNKPWKE